MTREILSGHFEAKSPIFRLKKQVFYESISHRQMSDLPKARAMVGRILWTVLLCSVQND